MALCAGVMAGIYASPVMAAQNGLKINGSDIEAENSVVINGVTMTEGRLGVENGIFAKTLNINGYAFTVDKFGNVNANDLTADTLSVAGDKFSVDNAGRVTTSRLNLSGVAMYADRDGNSLTVGSSKLSFDEANRTIANTAGIRRTQSGDTNVTVIEENLKVYGDGTIVGANENFKVTADGTVISDKLNVGNGNFTVSDEDIGAFDSKFTVNKNGEVSTTGVNVAEGMFTASAGGVTMANNNLSVDLNGNIKAGTYNGVKIGMNEDGDIILGDGTVIDDNFNSDNVAGIKRDPVAETTTIEGDFAVNGKDNTFGSANGSFTVDAEDGTFTAAKGAFKVREGVGETVIAGSIISSKDILGNYGSLNGSQLTLRAINGESTLIDAGRVSIDNGSSSTIISGGAITAETLNDKVIDDLVEGSDIADDLANIAGIERSEGAGDPGTGTTTIENNLKVSGDKINMFGDTGLTFEKGTMNGFNVINVSGNIGFNGSNVHFSYGSDGKTTTLGGLALTVDRIATDVSAIKEKTDHITVDEKGNVTISADDGSSLTVGKDGTSTGQGGQVTTDGNHTVTGDLDVDGSGQIDKDLTVGGDLEVGGKIDASEVNVGNTHITKDNGIETDKITVSGQGGSAIINGGYVGGSNDVFIDANGNNIFDEGETSLSGVNGKVDKVASDLGDVSILDHEIAGDSNNDGQNDVVGAVNNEAEIRRSEIERVDGRINNLENRVGELEDRIDKVGAMAAAIANLRTMGYDPAAPTEVAVGIGQYRDETGAALGLFHYPNRDFMLSLSVSTSGDEVMGGIGATWKFGRKSPEKVAEIKKAQAEADARRAEESKLAKAEEMKQAAKEAKIKAQQERHAKLAAERAAQAEAAK